MSYIFYSSISLIELKISFYTQNNINMENIFNKCNSLKSINLSLFNNQKIENMNFMFF